MQTSIVKTASVVHLYLITNLLLAITVQNVFYAGLISIVFCSFLTVGLPRYVHAGLRFLRDVSVRIVLAAEGGRHQTQDVRGSRRGRHRGSSRCRWVPTFIHCESHSSHKRFGSKDLSLSYPITAQDLSSAIHSSFDWLITGGSIVLYMSDDFPRHTKTVFFNAHHPFLFIIKKRADIVFMGRMVNPNAWCKRYIIIGHVVIYPGLYKSRCTSPNRMRSDRFPLVRSSSHISDNKTILCAYILQFTRALLSKPG